jgi:phosphoribosylformylglycinamidine cyclo-ligase
MSESNVSYAAAGVDAAAAAHAKQRIKALVESTFTDGVLGAFGDFGGMFRVPPPGQAGGGQVLVASADGVGTKIKVAVASGRHDTIGHDLVNHCVNDILVQGALPLFFLDYVAFGRLVPDVVEQVVAGVAAGCRENGCALIGGETAEMPGLYTPPDYDLAGFIVGIVNESGPMPGKHAVREGDALVALESSGLHTNGYSLARQIVFDQMRLGIGDQFPGEQATVADVLLRVHQSYMRPLKGFLPRIHAMAHITGGGIPGNLNRVLPSNLSAVVNTGSWPVPNLFQVLQSRGGVSDWDMFGAFNMGVGMVVVCDAGDVSELLSHLTAWSVTAWQAGRVVRGDGTVRMEGLT